MKLVLRKQKGAGKFSRREEVKDSLHTKGPAMQAPFQHHYLRPALQTRWRKSCLERHPHVHTVFSTAEGPRDFPRLRPQPCFRKQARLLGSLSITGLKKQRSLTGRATKHPQMEPQTELPLARFKPLSLQIVPSLPFPLLHTGAGTFRDLVSRLQRLVRNSAL